MLDIIHHNFQAQIGFPNRQHKSDQVTNLKVCTKKLQRKAPQWLRTCFEVLGWQQKPEHSEY